jgi:hypothetical protein
MRIPNWKKDIVLVIKRNSSSKSKITNSHKFIKIAITYHNVTKPHRIFDKSSYFRDVHLKNSKSKTTHIEKSTYASLSVSNTRGKRLQISL